MEKIEEYDTETTARINDLQCDFYGNKIAIGYSDGKVGIFEDKMGTLEKKTEFNAHEGAVLKVDWAHPKFCSLLGTCGSDKKAILWRGNGSSYEKVFEYSKHPNIVTYITFGSFGNDLIFACGSLDGMISVHQYNPHQDTFESQRTAGHPFGVNAISFDHKKAKRMVSCGNDSCIKEWEYACNNYLEIDSIEDNEEITKDVAYRPCSSDDSFASCGDDGIVYLHTKHKEIWSKKEIINTEEPLCKLIWNIDGSNLIAMTTSGQKHVITADILNTQS